MDKIKEMSEGIVVIDAPTHRTTIDGIKGKRSATTGETLQSVLKKLTVFTFSACVKCIESTRKLQFYIVVNSGIVLHYVKICSKEWLGAYNQETDH